MSTTAAPPETVTVATTFLFTKATKRFYRFDPVDSSLTVPQVYLTPDQYRALGQPDEVTIDVAINATA